MIEDILTARLHITYEADIETLEWIGGGRCGVYYLWQDRQLAGAISMTSLSRSNGEIGYRLEPDYRGLGLATEAVSAVVARAHDFHGFSMLSARARGSNIASHRVLLKAGFARVASRLTWARYGAEAIIVYHRLHARADAPAGIGDARSARQARKALPPNVVASAGRKRVS